MKRNPKMWVRLLAMLLIASLCLAMAACSETPASESEPTETTPTQPVETPTEPEETEPEETEPESVLDADAVYFVNTGRWPEVSAYVWSDDGGEEATWPGIPMTKTDLVAPNGAEVYTIKFDQEYDNIIFNNNNKGAQTPDLKMRPGYVYEIKMGAWYADLEEVPADSGTSAEEATVFYVNSLDWKEVGSYAWTDGGMQAAAWPGFPMTKTDEVAGNGADIYSITFDQAYENVIFNDNGKGAQTADLKFNAGQYFDGRTAKWYEDPADIPYVAPPVIKEHTIYCVNSTNWPEIRAYVWRADGSQAALWSGTRMTKTDKVAPNGADVYVVYIWDTFENIIFNNGGGVQTADHKFQSGQYFDLKTNTWYEKLEDIPTAEDLATDVYLAGSFNGWNTSANCFQVNTPGDTVGYITLSLEANTTYEFKVVNGGTWTSTTTAITGDTTGVAFSEANGGNATITTTAAGEYVFAYDMNGNTLAVTYPKVVYMLNSTGWEAVSAYAWNNGGSAVATWPGVAMTATGVTANNGAQVYSIVFNQTYENIIFNNGGAGAQTSDLTFHADQYYDVKTDTWYANLADVPGSAPEITDFTVYMINSANWAKVNAYAWNTGSDPAAAWPGASMTKTETVAPNGADVYKITLDKEYRNGIFNNGSGTQTADLVLKYGQYYDVKTNTWYASLDAVPGVDVLATDAFLVGSFNSWNTSANEFKRNAAGDAVGYLSMDLAADTTYEFKIVKSGSWTSTTTAITDSASDIAFSNSVNDNATITTKQAGTYVFAYSVADGKLSVTYPVSYTVYAINSTNWSTINAYAWVDGGDPASAWPGTAMTKTETVAPNGADVYAITFEEAYNKLILNNGSSQTSDLVFNAGQYYDLKTNTWYEKLEDVPAGGTEPQTYTVYAINSTNWSRINAYVWGGTGTQPSWPGLAMTKTETVAPNGADVYSITFDSAYSSLIFNSGSSQTGDLTFNAGQYYDLKSSTWYEKLEDVPAGGTETATYTLYVVNSGNWSAVSAYVWGGTGTQPSWPGLAMTKTETVAPNGADVYSITLDATYNNVIFNNKGGGAQTSDLAFNVGQYYDVKTRTWYANLEDIPAGDPLATDVYLVGSFNGWTTTSNEFKRNAAEDTVAYVSLNLKAETAYEFKLVKAGAWYGASAAVTATVSALTFSTSVSGNAKMTTTVAGDYLFAYDLTSGKLSITYPTTE